MFRSIGIVVLTVGSLALPCGAAEDDFKDKGPGAGGVQPGNPPAKGNKAPTPAKKDPVIASEENDKGSKTVDSVPKIDLPPAGDGLWLTNHSVRLRRDGNVPGQLRTVDASGELIPVHARLSFLHDGEIVGKAMAEQHGYFQAVGLHEGIYDVIAVGRDSFGAFSLKVTPMANAPVPSKTKSISYRDGGAVGMSEEERWEHLILSTTVLPAIDLFKAGQVIAYRIESFRLPGAAAPKGPAATNSPMNRIPALRNAPVPQVPGTPTGLPRLGALLKSNQAPLAIVPAALPGANRSRAIVELPGSLLPDDGPWYSGHTISMQSNGKIMGRVRSFDSNGELIAVVAHVHFIQNGRLVGMTLADSEGRFGVDGLNAGNYSVIVAGENAMGAFSIRVLPPDFQESLPRQPEGKASLENKIPGKAVAHRAIQPGGDMLISTIRWANFKSARDLMLENSALREGLMQPSIESGGAGPGGAGGGVAGGGGGATPGGGGGGGGGGGLGGLAAGAGLIGAAAALSQGTSTTSSAATSNTTTN